MTQDEAATILERQVYRFIDPDDGTKVEVVGVTALAEYANTRAGFDPTDIRCALIGISEFVRLGAAPMPENTELRTTFEGIIAYTSKWAVSV